MQVMNISPFVRDVPSLRVRDWAPGEVRDIPEQHATGLLAQEDAFAEPGSDRAVARLAELAADAERLAAELAESDDQPEEV